MKFWIAFVALIGVLINTQTLIAQELDPEQVTKLEERLADTKARLELTDEQVEQIKPILEANAEARQAVFDEHGIELDPVTQKPKGKRPNFRKIRAVKKDMQAVREETTAQMAEVLTEEQMEEYLKIQDERRSEFRERAKANR